MIVSICDETSCSWSSDFLNFVAAIFLRWECRWARMRLTRRLAPCDAMAGWIRLMIWLAIIPALCKQHPTEIFWCKIFFKWTAGSAWLAVPVLKKAKSSAGILFCEVKSVYCSHHTSTEWKTKKNIRKFVLSPIHQKAIKVFPQIATGFTMGYETDKIQSWDEALLLWWKTEVKLNWCLNIRRKFRPSPRHNFPIIRQLSIIKWRHGDHDWTHPCQRTLLQDREI